MGDIYYDVEMAATKEEYLLGQSGVEVSSSAADKRTEPPVTPKLPHVAQEDWRSRADCRNQHEIMYEHMGETKMMKIEREALARRICIGCRVLEQCLDQAINNNESGAVWGGLNDDERRELKKSRRAS